MNSQPARLQDRETFAHGELVIDAETGEVLGTIFDEDPSGPFRVHDRASAEWVLERLLETESEAAALRRRIEIITANIEVMARDHERRAKWLRERFGSELEAYAASELAGGKTRTWRSPFGKLSFRKSRARLVIDDEERAIKWARGAAPGALEVKERLLVSQLPEAVIEAAKDDPAMVPPGFKIEPERDAFKVETGA